MIWRARSASDKQDDWPFWYVTRDKPNDYNETCFACEMIIGKKLTGLPFISKELAIALAERMNNAESKQTKIPTRQN